MSNVLNFIGDAYATSAHVKPVVWMETAGTMQVVDPKAKNAHQMVGVGAPAGVAMLAGLDFKPSNDVNLRYIAMATTRHVTQTESISEKLPTLADAVHQVYTPVLGTEREWHDMDVLSPQFLKLGLYSLIRVPRLDWNRLDPVYEEVLEKRTEPDPQGGSREITDAVVKRRKPEEWLARAERLGAVLYSLDRVKISSSTWPSIPKEIAGDNVKDNWLGSTQAITLLVNKHNAIRKLYLIQEQRLALEVATDLVDYLLSYQDKIGLGVADPLRERTVKAMRRLRTIPLAPALSIACSVPKAHVYSMVGEGEGYFTALPAAYLRNVLKPVAITGDVILTSALAEVAQGAMLRMMRILAQLVTAEGNNSALDTDLFELANLAKMNISERGQTETVEMFNDRVRVEVAKLRKVITEETTNLVALSDAISDAELADLVDAGRRLGWTSAPKVTFPLVQSGGHVNETDGDSYQFHPIASVLGYLPTFIQSMSAAHPFGKVFFRGLETGEPLDKDGGRSVWTVYTYKSRGTFLTSAAGWKPSTQRIIERSTLPHSASMGESNVEISPLPAVLPGLDGLGPQLYTDVMSPAYLMASAALADSCRLPDKSMPMFYYRLPSEVDRAKVPQVGAVKTYYTLTNFIVSVDTGAQQGAADLRQQAMHILKHTYDSTTMITDVMHRPEGQNPFNRRMVSRMSFNGEYFFLPIDGGGQLSAPAYELAQDGNAALEDVPLPRSANDLETYLNLIGPAT